MHLLRILLAALLGSAGLVWFTASPAAACDCATAGVTHLIRRADALFTGVVVDTTDDAASLTTAYAVDVRRVFVGKVGDEATVTSPTWGASCGLEGVLLGGTHVFFALRDEGELTSGLCSGTGPATERLLHLVESRTSITLLPPAPPTAGEILAAPTRPSSARRFAGLASRARN